MSITIGGLRLEFEALIDSGFSGEVTVPSGLISQDHVPFANHRWQLADGTYMTAPIFVGLVTIAGHGPYPVTIAEAGPDAMIGVEVIKFLNLTLEYGRRVIVAP